MGFDHNIYFSRATQVYIWIRITLTKSLEEDYPADGDDLITEEAVNIGSTYQIGEDVLVQEFFKAVFSVTGVASALIEVATSATEAGPPGTYQTTNISLLESELADFDSTRITIL
jgi:hypothetical protein